MIDPGKLFTRIGIQSAKDVETVHQITEDVEYRLG